MLLTRARMRTIRGGAEGNQPPKNPHHRHWRRRERQRAGSRLPGRARAQSKLQAEISAELRGHVRNDPGRAQYLRSRRQRGQLPLRERELRSAAGELANCEARRLSSWILHLVTERTLVE